MTRNLRITAAVMLAAFGFALGPNNSAFGKGPKDVPGVSTKDAKSKYSRGYSNQGVADPYGKAVKPTRLPTQPTPQVTRPTTTISKPDKYSTVRPTTRPQVTHQFTPPAQSSTNKPPVVQFPPRTKPSASTAGISVRPSTLPTQRPTTQSSVQNTQRPPVVFYPHSSHSVTQPSRPVTQPTQPRPSNTNTYYPSLRPAQTAPVNRPQVATQPIVINRPTTINQTTTNVTNQVNNTNTWYQGNHWQNQVSINGSHWNNRPWWDNSDHENWQHGHWNANNYPQRPSTTAITVSNNWVGGLSSWSMGNLVYRTGYQGYRNPYRERALVIGSTSIDYALPITVQISAYERAVAADAEKAQRLRLQALALFSAARINFYRGDYAKSYDDINRAIAIMPDDVALHEFRALVLFAAGRFQDSAEVIHAVLAVAPGWDWTTMSGLYADNDTYLLQLRRLEQFIRDNPRDGAARFLLAYHYITLRHPESAAAQLQATLTIYPDDKLSADLLQLLSEEYAREHAYELPAGRPPTLAELQGEWRARRSDGKIDLEFEGDTFAWDYDLVENDSEFRGRFALNQNVLVFATSTGSQMAGTVTLIDRDHLNFRLLSAQPDDPGVVFARD